MGVYSSSFTFSDSVVYWWLFGFLSLFYCVAHSLCKFFVFTKLWSTPYETTVVFGFPNTVFVVLLLSMLGSFCLVLWRNKYPWVLLIVGSNVEVKIDGMVLLARTTCWVCILHVSFLCNWNFQVPGFVAESFPEKTWSFTLKSCILPQK